MTRTRRPMLAVLLALSMAVPMAAVLVRGTAADAATALPSGFSEQVVLSGLDHPTKVAFAPDGRVFVAEKKGVIKVFDSVSDPTPDVFADLSTNVFDYEDLGLLGLALPPDFPANPTVYVSYSYDAPIGGVAPVYNDHCTAPGRCVASGRVSRLTAAGNRMTGPEQVLLNDWCVQFESHHMGDLRFGPDGALYVTGGEGSTASYADWGQSGNPVNPCGDPPGGVGGAMSPPSAEGGALRAQDVRTPGDPTGLSGTLIRVDPLTGAARPGNPLYASSTDSNARRIVAAGLRNPFRWTFRPGTAEVWLADTGWRNWEEIDRLPDPQAATSVAGLTNFGWPCYEGSRRQPGFDNADLSLCESLYSAGTATPPYFEYAHSDKVGGAADPCPTGGSSPTGMAFYPTGGGTFPARYAGALFFADYARQCVYAMLPGAGGLPDAARTEVFAPGAATPVDLEIGPGGDLYYVDLGGTVRRIRYSSGNQPPTAAASATPTSGPPPLAVAFNATGSSDPDPGEALTYQWDFTGDGTFDATGATASWTYGTAGTYTARLRVTDAGGLSDTTTVQIRAGTAAPVPVIDTPAAAAQWTTGQTVAFTGHATDQQGRLLPASGLKWELLLQHCTTADSCHTHPLQTWSGVASGSFTGADHEYPSYLQLRLTATDGGGLSGATTLRLDPRTVNLSFATNPPGLQLTVGATSGVTPFTRTVIQGSTVTVSAPATQSTYTFGSWSQGGSATQAITAPAAATTYTASYAGPPPTPPPATSDGYIVTTQARPFVSADNVLPLTGDDAVARIALPFPVRLYGRAYSTAWVDTNGAVSLADPGGSRSDNTALPSTRAAGATVYPFWGDLRVDAAASVLGKAIGSAPNRQYVIEWRNVHVYGNTSQRLSAEAILSENGDVVTNYAGLDNDAERGAGATVGIEDAGGAGAVQRSYNAPAMRSGQAVVFTAPAAPGGPGGTPPPSPPPAAGYTVTTVAAPFVPAGATVLPLTGDDNLRQVTLPAPVRLYGVTYTGAWVDTNGKLSFVNPGTAYVEHGALPSTAQPNASVYPFWQDLVVDAQASVRMAALDGGVVIEWRNVCTYGNTSRRLSFSVVFATDGRITLHYASLDSDAERGAGATVGVENAAGTAAAQFSYNQPRLAAGTAVVFIPTP